MILEKTNKKDAKVQEGAPSVIEITTTFEHFKINCNFVLNHPVIPLVFIQALLLRVSFLVMHSNFPLI